MVFRVSVPLFLAVGQYRQHQSESVCWFLMPETEEGQLSGIFKNA